MYAWIFLTLMINNQKFTNTVSRELLAHLQKARCAYKEGPVLGCSSSLCSSAIEQEVPLRRAARQGRGDSVKIESHGLKIKGTLRGSFSAVSTPMFGSKYSLESSCLCTAQTSIFQQKFVNVFLRFEL